ncbi:Chaperone protein DnaJ [compost metagenome]
MSYEQKLETFTFLSQISLIDNELNDKEKEYLLFLIQRFGILNQDIPENLADLLFGRKGGQTEEKSTMGYNRYYLLLELTENASAREIKEAYRKLVKKYHPDSHPDLSEAEKKQLAQKFHEVQEAYDALVNA